MKKMTRTTGGYVRTAQVVSVERRDGRPSLLHTHSGETRLLAGEDADIGETIRFAGHDVCVDCIAEVLLEGPRRVVVRAGRLTLSEGSPDPEGRAREVAEAVG